MVRIFERYVTKFAPHKDLKLTAWDRLTFDERAILRRAGHLPHADTGYPRRKVHAARERGEKTSNRFKDFCAENGSSHG